MLLDSRSTTTTRRGFLAGATALAAFAGSGARGATATAPLRSDLSVGLGATGMNTTQVTALTTYQIAIELECPTELIRLGVANNIATAASLGGVCCCEASADAPFTPLSGSEWRYLKFGGGTGGAPATVTIPGNAVVHTGATNVPATLYSDWLPFRSTAPGRPVLLFRVLVPPQTMAMSMVGWPSNSATVLPNYTPRVRLVNTVAGDFVTDPLQVPPTGQPAELAPFHVLRSRGTVPGIQIVVGGDSELGSWATFAQLCGLTLSTPEQPIAVWDVAWASMPSATFWPVLQDAITQGQPSVSVIQGWTANDGFNAAAYANYLARVRRSVAYTQRIGGIPIVTTGMPRDLYGTADLAGWESYNNALPTRLPQTTVFNLDTLVEDSSEPGNWIPDLSNDGIHPNLEGDQVMAGGFQPLLTPLLPWS